MGIDINDVNVLLAIAYIYDKGLGCDKKLSKAQELYRKAEQLGSKEAKKELKSLRFLFVKPEKNK